MATTQLGMNAVLRLRAGGLTGGSGTWVEADNAMDVTLSLESAEADVTTRANDGWRATVGTLKDASIELEQIFDPTDEAFQILRDAFLDETTVGVECLSGPTGSSTASGTNTGSDANEGEGLRANMRVTNFSQTQPLEDAIKVSATLKVTRSGTAPSWINGRTS